MQISPAVKARRCMLFRYAVVLAFIVPRKKKKLYAYNMPVYKDKNIIKKNPEWAWSCVNATQHHP